MTIKLPSLPYFSSFKIHPSYDKHDAYGNRFAIATRDYIDRFRLYADDIQRERIIKSKVDLASALIYPVGTDELLQIGSDFFAWTVAYDDEYCDEGPLSKDPAGSIQASAEIWRQFESPEYKTSDDRYAAAARDIRIRLDRYATPEQVGRVVEGMRLYMMAEMWMAANLTPTLSDCVAMRIPGGGSFLWAMLGHVIAGIDISQREYEDRRVRILTEISAYIVGSDGDYHGFGKEDARSGDHKNQNFLHVLMRERGYSLNDAFEEYLWMRRAILGLAVRLRKELETNASDGLKDYIESTVKYYLGAATWITQTFRYTSQSGTGDDKLFETDGPIYKCTLESFSDCLDIVDVPSIRWWWEYDPARRKSLHASVTR